MALHVRKIARHYFLPHESNNYKARTLHAPLLVFYILVLFVFQSFFSLGKRLEPNILGYATDITVEKILYLVNQERVKADLRPLSLSAELSNAATAKAGDMFEKNYWAHVSPTGTTPWKFITSSGYNYLYAGENLAKDFATSDEVVQAWMRSPTHRANLLKPEYTNIGLAILNGRLNGDDTTLVVQEFGSPLKKAPAIEPLSASVEPDNYLSEQTAARPIPFLRAPTKTLSFIMAEFLLVVLMIDGIYMWKKKTMRIGSHTLAHIIFLAALIGAMGATGIGVIL